MEKVCTRCGVVKLLMDFYKSRGGLYGRSSMCKPCRYEAYEKPRPCWRVCNKCGLRELHHHSKHCLKCDVKKATLWKRQHPKVAAAQQRRYTLRHPERKKALIQRRKQWFHEGDVTVEQLRELVVRSRSRCHYCGVVVKCRCIPAEPRGFDHVLPRGRGGKHTISNMVVCCWPCNTSKGLKDAA